ncbi:hypothetical protein BDZ97DRAFT_1916050 [Flammula alnicola]|nr:hypothetical protein BDZ97DRAFT_1916050 [Flammula alnicola]
MLGREDAEQQAVDTQLTQLMNIETAKGHKEEAHDTGPGAVASFRCKNIHDPIDKHNGHERGRRTSRGEHLSRDMATTDNGAGGCRLTPAPPSNRPYPSAPITTLPMSQHPAPPTTPRIQECEYQAAREHHRTPRA